MRILVCIVSCVALMACASPEEAASNECQNLGLTPNTQAFNSCYQQYISGDLTFHAPRNDGWRDHY
jgi:hypothetical protein